MHDHSSAKQTLQFVFVVVLNLGLQGTLCGPPCLRARISIFISSSLRCPESAWPFALMSAGSRQPISLLPFQAVLRLRADRLPCVVWAGRLHLSSRASLPVTLAVPVAVPYLLRCHPPPMLCTFSLIAPIPAGTYPVLKDASTLCAFTFCVPTSKMPLPSSCFLGKTHPSRPSSGSSLEA